MAVGRSLARFGTVIDQKKPSMCGTTTGPACGIGSDGGRERDGREWAIVPAPDAAVTHQTQSAGIQSLEVGVSVLHAPAPFRAAGDARPNRLSGQGAAE